MVYSFQLITPKLAKIAAGWQYSFPYDFYNIPKGRQRFAVRGYLNPNYAYHSIMDENENWIGICTFGADARVAGGDYTETAIDIGLGLCPDLTGRGLGTAVVAAILDFATSKNDSNCTFRATIASFNRRSQRVFEKNGFHRCRTFRPLPEFVFRYGSNHS